MWVAFAMQKLLTFFQPKISMYMPYFKIEIFNIMLANNIKFWTTGPRCLKIAGWVTMSVDTDQMLYSAVSGPSLQCLLKPTCPNT